MFKCCKSLMCKHRPHSLFMLMRAQKAPDRSLWCQYKRCDVRTFQALNQQLYLCAFGVQLRLGENVTVVIEMCTDLLLSGRGGDVARLLAGLNARRGAFVWSYMYLFGVGSFLRTKHRMPVNVLRSRCLTAVCFFLSLLYPSPTKHCPPPPPSLPPHLKRLAQRN